MEMTPIEQVESYLSVNGDDTGVTLCFALRERERTFMAEFLEWYRRHPSLVNSDSDDVVMLYMRTIHGKEANKGK